MKKNLHPVLVGKTEETVARLTNGPGDPKNKKLNADSLMSESFEKKAFARTQEKIAKGQIKKDGGNVPMIVGGFTAKPVYGPSGNQRMEIVKKARQSASKDSALAVKIKPSLTPKKK